MKFYKKYQGYFVGLCVAAEVVMLVFAFINFIKPILDSMGSYGEFLTYASSAILPASGAWNNFELWKYLGKLAIGTHLKIIAAMLFLLTIAHLIIKPLPSTKSNGPAN